MGSGAECGTKQGKCSSGEALKWRHEGWRERKEKSKSKSKRERKEEEISLSLSLFEKEKRKKKTRKIMSKEKIRRCCYPFLTNRSQKREWEEMVKESTKTMGDNNHRQTDSACCLLSVHASNKQLKYLSDTLHQQTETLLQ